jgi:hypothetical protein
LVVGAALGVATRLGVGVGVVSITRVGEGNGLVAVVGPKRGDAATVIPPATRTTSVARNNMAVRIEGVSSR